MIAIGTPTNSSTRYQDRELLIRLFFGTPVILNASSNGSVMILVATINLYMVQEEILSEAAPTRVAVRDSGHTLHTAASLLTMHQYIQHTTSQVPHAPSAVCRDQLA